MPHRTRGLFRRGLIALLLPFAVLGCASGPVVSNPAEEPEDFTLDVSVLVGFDWPERPEVHLRTGRFILLADGSLHAGRVARRAAMSLPERRRVLNRREMARLWGLVHELGLGPEAADLTGANGALFKPTRNQLAYVVEITGNDHRWALARVTDGRLPPDPGPVALVRELARLAWESDLPEERVTVAPRRYDFGSDPYARFRR